MVDRKPPGTSTSSWIEKQISDAMQKGAFDNLPGAGKPLPNIGKGFDPDRWVLQLLEREGAHVTPRSLELRRKAERELEAALKLDNEEAIRECVASLNAEIGKFNAHVVEGLPTNLAQLDVDQVLARWRASRAPEPQ